MDPKGLACTSSISVLRTSSSTASNVTITPARPSSTVNNDVNSTKRSPRIADQMAESEVRETIDSAYEFLEASHRQGEELMASLIEEPLREARAL